jgi:outer membrane immunogenic protein
MYRFISFYGPPVAFAALLAAAPGARAQVFAMDQRAPFSGCYAGVHGGGLLGTVTSRETFAGFARFGEQKADVSALVAGVQAGCNMVSGAFMGGLEIEGFAPFRNSGFNGLQELGEPTYRNRLDYKSRIGGALSLRGGVVMGNTLLFMKAGAAYAPVQVAHAYDYGEYPDRAAGWDRQPFERATAVKTTGRDARASLLLGAGVEYAIAPQWTLKAEYNALIAPRTTISAKGTSTDYRYVKSETTEGYQYDPAVAVTRDKSMATFRNVFKVGVNRQF